MSCVDKNRVLTETIIELMADFAETLYDTCAEQNVCPACATEMLLGGVLAAAFQIGLTRAITPEVFVELAAIASRRVQALIEEDNEDAGIPRMN